MNPSCSPTVACARNFFPRGLCQPDRGFRFSMDALLLACFAEVKFQDVVGDLGTGCGVVGIGLLLRHGAKDIQVIGVDAEDEMVHVARTNTATLGYDDRMQILQGDVCEPGNIVGPESMDVIVCNPPYRQTGRGRSCTDGPKNRARFEVRASLETFVRGAGFMLKNRGRIFFVYLAEQLDLLLFAMQSSRIVPKRMLPVHARPGQPARLVLVEGRKNGGQGMVLEPPLFLYQCGKNSTCLSGEALEFCPFLACNAHNL